MNSVCEKFAELKAKKEKAFIAYITCGDPDLKTTARLVMELERSGVDLVELGMPFSDPLADGPTIQRASERALRQNTTLSGIFTLAKTLKKKITIPLVLLSYYNPLLKFGLGRFVKEAKAAGIEGVIVPDLPPEEGKRLKNLADRQDFALIFLVAPTSTPERIRKIVGDASGFIYCVSLTGVTGARRCLPPGVAAKIREIRKVSEKPVAVGFGISTPGQAVGIARFADGIIVGSAIVRVVEAAARKREVVKKVGGFVRPLVKAVKTVRGL